MDPECRETAHPAAADSDSSDSDKLPEILIPSVRRIPRGGALVEVRTQTIQGRALLRPSDEINKLVVGVLATAQKSAPVSIIATITLPNEQRTLIFTKETAFMSKFMCHLNSNVAREVGEEVDWEGKFWARRYESTVISDQPEAQEAKLKELLSLAVKARYVARPNQFPGLDCVSALLGDGELHGHWRNRTKESELKRSGKEPKPEEYLTKETVKLAPLPCWEELALDEMRQRVRGMLAEIEKEGETERASSGKGLLGVKRICKLKPHGPTPGETLPKNPTPGFFASTPKVLEEMRQDYRTFYGKYRKASHALRSEDPDAEPCPFPKGCHPPAGPYVPYSKSRMKAAEQRLSAANARAAE